MAKKKMSTAAEVGIGLAAGAAVAAIAGAYYLYGTKAGAKNMKKIKGWALKAKGEVLEELEALKQVNENAYRQAVNKVTKRYQKIKKIDPKEIVALANDLKKHWINIQKHLKAVKKPAHRKGSSKRRR